MCVPPGIRAAAQDESIEHDEPIVFSSPPAHPPTCEATNAGTGKGLATSRPLTDDLVKIPGHLPALYVVTCKDGLDNQG